MTDENSESVDGEYVPGGYYATDEDVEAWGDETEGGEWIQTPVGVIPADKCEVVGSDDDRVAHLKSGNVVVFTDDPPGSGWWTVENAVGVDEDRVDYARGFFFAEGDVERLDHDPRGE